MANSIPMLDLSDVNHPKLLKELRFALLNVGFLYIKNHGVSLRVVDDLVNTLPKLFALPAEEKEKVALIKSPHFLGCSRFGSETTASVRDQREQFEFATELLDESNAE